MYEPVIAECCMPQQMAFNVQLYNTDSVLISYTEGHEWEAELFMWISCLIFCLVMLMWIRNKPN